MDKNLWHISYSLQASTIRFSGFLLTNLHVDQASLLYVGNENALSRLVRVSVVQENLRNQSFYVKLHYNFM